MCLNPVTPPGPDEPFVYSHPKLEKLEEVVLHHFRLCAESAADPGGAFFRSVAVSGVCAEVQ